MAETVNITINDTQETVKITVSEGGSGGVTDYNDLSNKPTTITAQQASDISTNNAKISFPEIPFTKVIDSGDLSGTQNIDWSLAIKHRINLTGNITLTFSNYSVYEESKIHTIEVTSAGTGNTVTFPSGVELNDIKYNPLDFSTSTKKNFLSFRYLGNNLFQASNYVR